MTIYFGSKDVQNLPFKIFLDRSLWPTVTFVEKNGHFGRNNCHFSLNVGHSFRNNGHFGSKDGQSGRTKGDFSRNDGHFCNNDGHFHRKILNPLIILADSHIIIKYITITYRRSLNNFFK